MDTILGRLLGESDNSIHALTDLYLCELINTNSWLLVFYPSQVPHFSDLDFVADHLGQLCLYKGTMNPTRLPPQDSALIIFDPKALAHHIKALVGPNLEPE